MLNLLAQGIEEILGSLTGKGLGGALAVAALVIWRLVVAYRAELIANLQRERDSAAALAKAQAELEACRARLAESREEERRHG